MKFEHLIEINDLNPMRTELSRAQLWQGLLLRIEQPALFLPHLDACQILQREATRITRRLRFGEVLIEDAVHLQEQQQIHIDVAAQNEFPASQMWMRIEEPEAGRLFVRFIYHDAGQEADAANQMYDDFRRSAYIEMDIESISLIRQFAAQGKLG